MRVLLEIVLIPVGAMVRVAGLFGGTWVFFYVGRLLPKWVQRSDFMVIYFMVGIVVLGGLIIGAMALYVRGYQRLTRARGAERPDR